MISETISEADADLSGETSEPIVLISMVTKWKNNEKLKAFLFGMNSAKWKEKEKNLKKGLMS